MRLLILGWVTFFASFMAQAQSYPQNFHAANENLWTSGFVQTADEVAALKQAGIDVVISLIDPNELPGVDEPALLKDSGIAWVSLPIRGADDLTLDNVKTLDGLLSQHADQQVLVHCASGNRVGAMMALRAAWLKERSVEDALLIGQRFGLTRLQPAVEQRLKSTVER